MTNEELKKRLEALRARKVDRTNPIKDQTGVDLSTIWLAENRKLDDGKVTEKIDAAHYLSVRRKGKCLACGCDLQHSANAGSTGSLFMMCSACGWYIGYRMTKGHGNQARVEQWQARAA